MINWNMILSLLGRRLVFSLVWEVFVWEAQDIDQTQVLAFRLSLFTVRWASSLLTPASLPVVIFHWLLGDRLCPLTVHTNKRVGFCLNSR